MQKLVSRRQALKWCGSAATLPAFWPFMQGLLSEAQGQAVGHKSYLQFNSSNGIFKNQYHAAFAGKNEQFLSDAPLPKIFQPFEAVKEDMLLMSDFYCPFSPDIHGPEVSIFGMRDGPVGGRKRAMGGQTLDRLLGERLGQDAPFQSLNLVCAVHKGYTQLANLSGDGYGQPFAADYRPLETFERLFSVPLNPMGPSASELMDRKRSVLDFAHAEVEQMKSRLAGAERAKLEQVTESIRGLEGQLDRLIQSQASCMRPETPAATLDAAEPAIAEVDVNGRESGGGSVVNPAIADAFFALIETALVCRQTHAVNLNFGTGGMALVYGFLGDGIRDIHTHSHKARIGRDVLEELDPNNEDFVRATEMLYKVWHYCGGKIVDLYQRLKTVPDGDSNLAENGVMLWTSDCGGFHHGGYKTYPLVLLGKAGGRLDTGRFLNFGDGGSSPDADPPPHSLSDPFVTIAHALGVELDSFGDPQHFKGLLPGVLA